MSATTNTNYTAFGKLYSTTFIDASLDGSKLTLKRSNSENDLTLDLSSVSAAADKVVVNNSNQIESAISDAHANFIGILPSLRGDYNTSDDTNVDFKVDLYQSTTTPDEGKVMRFFVDGSADASTKKYRIMYDTIIIAYMRNGEAYTFIRNGEKYLVVPGIINPKSKI